MADEFRGDEGWCGIRPLLPSRCSGKVGVDLLPVLEGGAAGPPRHEGGGERLGATLTRGGDHQALDAYGDAIDKIGLASKATGRETDGRYGRGGKGPLGLHREVRRRIELFYARVFGGEDAVAATKEKQAAAGVKTTGEFVGPTKPKVEGPNLEARRRRTRAEEGAGGLEEGRGIAGNWTRSGEKKRTMISRLNGITAGLQRLQKSPEGEGERGVAEADEEEQELLRSGRCKIRQARWSPGCSARRI